MHRSRGMLTNELNSNRVCNVFISRPPHSKMGCPWHFEGGGAQKSHFSPQWIFPEPVNVLPLSHPTSWHLGMKSKVRYLLVLWIGNERHNTNFQLFTTLPFIDNVRFSQSPNPEHCQWKGPPCSYLNELRIANFPGLLILSLRQAVHFLLLL